MLNKNDQPFPQENSQIEYKECWSDKQVKKEICAFLNGKKKAFIYLGVDDQSRKITNPYTNDEKHAIEEKVSHWLTDAYYPTANGLVTVHVNNEPLAIEVKPGSNTPYRVKIKDKSHVFIRNNSSSEKASPGDVQRLDLENNLGNYDKEKSSVQDLTFNVAKKKFHDINKSFNPDGLNFYYKNNIYSNNALLFSDENNFTTKIASFDGNTTFKFKDRKEVGGSILKQIDYIMEYIKLNNHIMSDINDNGQRVDHPDYPIDAVREAVVNAFAHRSYYDDGFNQIELYDNRIEIMSPGPLPKGLRTKDILAGRSQPRNYNLLNVLVKLRYAEQYGTGVRRIESIYNKYNDNFKIEAGSNFVKAILPNLNYQHYMIKHKRNMIAHNPESYDLKTIELTFDENKIIDYLINKQSAITRKEVQIITNSKMTKAHSLISDLIDNGVIYRRGKGRNTKYSLINR